MQEVIFNTKIQADARQALDYALYLTRIPNPAVRTSTTAWATPKQRLDGKWAYPVLSGADYTGHNVANYNPANYPQPTPEPTEE